MDLERLINRHKNSVYRQMVRVCGNHEDAEDALADAIFAAISASTQLRDAANFQAWLSRIGSRACSRMRIRSRLVQLSSLENLELAGFEVADTHQDTAAEVETANIKRCVAGAIQLLPVTLRDVYLRREISGESANSVAQSLDISVAAVKTRLHRAREQVRLALDSGLGC